MIVRAMTAACIVTALVGTGVGDAHTQPPGHTLVEAAPKSEPRPASTPPAPEKRSATPTKTQADADGATSKSVPSPAAQPTPAPSEPTRTADEALALLVEGNARWINDRAESPNTDAQRRKTTAEKGQKPFVTVLTCADSRVPVEQLFDRGVGEVFAVRVAGSVVGDHEIGTIEYGVGHLHTPLVVVMGHSKCGAVAATVSDADVHGRIRGLVECIRPSVERARKLNPTLSGDELVSAAVRENVWQSVFELLKSSDEIRESVLRSEVRVVGAVYDIASGRVEVLGEHPWQSQLMGALGSANGRGATAQVEPAASGHH